MSLKPRTFYNERYHLPMLNIVWKITCVSSFCIIRHNRQEHTPQGHPGNMRNQISMSILDQIVKELDHLIYAVLKCCTF